VNSKFDKKVLIVKYIISQNINARMVGPVGESKLCALWCGGGAMEHYRPDEVDLLSLNLFQ